MGKGLGCGQRTSPHSRDGGPIACGSPVWEQFGGVRLPSKCWQSGFRWPLVTGPCTRGSCLRFWILRGPCCQMGRACSLISGGDDVTLEGGNAPDYAPPHDSLLQQGADPAAV